MKTTDSNSPSKTKIFLATALATAMIGYTKIIIPYWFSMRFMRMRPFPITTDEWERTDLKT